MKRRHALVTLAVMGLSVLPATAHAVGAGTIVSPSADQQVAGSVAISSNVTGDNRDMFGNGPDHVVTVRLSSSSSGGRAPGTSLANLSCTGGTCNADSTWGGATFSASSFAPFGRPSEACNGAWYIQADVDGSGYGPTQRFLVSQLPAAPTGLAVTAGTAQATMSWNANSEPDLAGYRVQRRTTGAATWATLGDVAAGATTYTDAVEAGSYDYRVMSLRPDGRGADGAPAATCSDTGRELSAASAPRTVQVAAPTTSGGSTGGSTGGSSTGGATGGSSGGATTPSEEPTTDGPTTGDSTTDGSTTGGSTTGDSTTGDSTTGDSTTGDSTTGDSTAGGTTPEGDDSTSVDANSATNDAGSTTPDNDGTTPIIGSGPRAKPPSRTGGRSSTLSINTNLADAGDGAAPQVAAPQPRTRYFGEDSGFTEEMDFGDSDVIAGSEMLTREILEERMIQVPGALQTMFGEELAVARILNSIAGGLILLVLALHLRRWTREGAQI